MAGSSVEERFISVFLLHLGSHPWWSWCWGKGAGFVEENADRDELAQTDPA